VLCAVYKCNTLGMYDQTNDGSLQYKASKTIHDAGITSCVCDNYKPLSCVPQCIVTLCRYDASQSCLFTAGFDNVIKCFLDEPQVFAAGFLLPISRFTFHAQASMIPMWTCKTAAPPVSLAVLGGSQRLLYAALKGAPPMIIDERIGEDFTLFQLGNLSHLNRF
jgi:hypothetical protein